MFFMAHMAIPMIAFHGVESIYIYTCIFIFICLCYICIVYVVEEVHHSGGARSINGHGA